ncbi:helix-turn-helix transcriptional regulator [Streptomyces virginiae]|uniref:helix-turn-helix domain-containing protein n=1 Tax=Streptomyces virginiae TaxID=1961 RepID=UPI002DD8EEDB|nr:helix-turn-helix transcriptional regulator [Streptomyces virginiae]WSC79185.1 helix-turn-helix transcriptional regulator [Streptomyces virginiae]
MRVVSFSVPAWFPSYEEPGAEAQAPSEDAPDGPTANGDGTAERPTDAQLTEQESAVFLCLATGASNRELAVELQLSVSTVKFHVVNIRAKLGGISRLQACLLAALAREDTRRAADAVGSCDRIGLSDGGGAAVPR